MKSEEKVEEVQQPATVAVSNVEVKAESIPVEKSAEPEAEVKAEEAPKERNGRRDNREGRGGNRDNRGRGQGRPRGDYRRRENEEPRERRQYKPKNGEREPEMREESGSSDDDEPEAREFRREEIRKLEEEGFTVVGGGKAKPKPKDPREQRSYHDRQHGNKHHHHGKANNY